MSHLLDTNVLIYLFKNQGRVRERLDGVADHAVKVPSIAVYELQYGALKSSRPEAQAAQLQAVLSRFGVLDFDLPCAASAAQVRFHLEHAGTPVGVADILIAGTALAHNLTVVTRERCESSRVPGLRVENWYD